MPTAMKHDLTRADELSEHRVLDRVAAEIHNEEPEAKLQKREDGVPPEVQSSARLLKPQSFSSLLRRHRLQ